MKISANAKNFSQMEGVFCISRTNAKAVIPCNLSCKSFWVLLFRFCFIPYLWSWTQLTKLVSEAYTFILSLFSYCAFKKIYPFSLRLQSLYTPFSHSFGSVIILQKFIQAFFISVMYVSHSKVVMHSRRTYGTCGTKLTWSLDIQWCNFVCRYVDILCIWVVQLIMMISISSHPPLGCTFPYVFCIEIQIIGTDEEWKPSHFILPMGVHLTSSSLGLDTQFQRT